jgi:hypothetical protein
MNGKGFMAGGGTGTLPVKAGTFPRGFPGRDEATWEAGSRRSRRTSRQRTIWLKHCLAQRNWPIVETAATPVIDSLEALLDERVFPPIRH